MASNFGPRLAPANSHAPPPQDASNRRVRFSPSPFLSLGQRPESPPEPAPTTFSAKLRSSLKGLGRSSQSSKNDTHKSVRERKISAPPAPRPASSPDTFVVPRGILLEPRTSPEAAQGQLRPASEAGIARRSPSSPTPQADDAPRPSSVPPRAPSHSSHGRSSSMQYVQQVEGIASSSVQEEHRVERPDTPPTLVLPTLLTESPASPRRKSSPPFKPEHPVVAGTGDLGGLSSTYSELLKTRIPSMRFEDLGATFTKELHKSIYAADGASYVSPPGTPRSHARTRSSPRAARLRTAGKSTPSSSGKSKEKEQDKMKGQVVSSRQYSPKRRRRHVSPAEAMPPSAPLPSASTNSGNSTSQWLQAPQVKVQPPTPILDDGAFEKLPLDDQDLSEPFEMINSSSSWMPLDASATSIRSIADITNDKSPASPGSSGNSTPPLSPSSTADSMMNSTCTSLTSPSLMLSNAIDLSDMGLGASPKSRSKGKARAISSPMDLVEADEEEEDGDVQIEKLMLSLQRPYSFRRSMEPGRRDQPLPLGLGNQAGGYNKNEDLFFQLNTGLDTLQERFHRTWSPKQELEDPFSFLARSDTDSPLSTGVLPGASSVQYTTANVGAQAQYGDLDFGELHLDSPASRGTKRSRHPEHKQAFKPLHTPEGSLWDLQEAVVCMGDRVEVSHGFAY